MGDQVLVRRAVVEHLNVGRGLNKKFGMARCRSPTGQNKKQSRQGSHDRRPGKPETVQEMILNQTQIALEGKVEGVQGSRRFWKGPDPTVTRRWFC